MERVYSAYFNTEKKNASETKLVPSSRRRPSGNFRNRKKQLQKIASECPKVLYAGLRGFLFAYSAKAVTAVLLASRRWNSLQYGYLDAVRLLLKRDTIRFGLFIGALIGSFRISQVTAMILRGKRDRMNHAIAGAVAGSTLLLDSPARRSTISLYIFVRAVDVVGRHLTCAGLIPAWQYSSELLFSLCNGPIMYAFLFEPEVISKSYYKFILNMGAMTHEGLGCVFREHLKKPSAPFRHCKPHYHIESCVTHNVVDFFRGLSRSIPLYLPVHLLPAVVFRYRQTMKSPVATSVSTVHAVFKSAVFLSAYQIIVKITQCLLRNIRRKDSIYHGWLAGWATGFALLFEHPKRRSEMTLYCAVHALDILWKLLKRRRLIKRPPGGEVLMFCFSMSLIMSSPPQHFKSTYLAILRFLFGQRVFETQEERSTLLENGREDQSTSDESTPKAIVQNLPQALPLRIKSELQSTDFEMIMNTNHTNH